MAHTNIIREHHFILRLSGRSMYDVLISHVSFLTRFNKIAIHGTRQMAVDKEAISLSRVYSYYSKCNLSLFYV